MSAAESREQPCGGTLLACDYGVMVEMLGHSMGVLLLREGRQCPAESPEQELELRGSASRLVPITIYLRKADPEKAEQTYHRGASFLFMPRFDEHKARIRVSLAADATGALTLRVLDLATNQVLQLQRCENREPQPMTGPPCRGIGESAGLLLLHCWQDYCLSRGYTITGQDGAPLLGLELPEVFDLHQLEAHVSRWVEDQERTTEALWNGACRIARESLRLAESISEPREALGEAMDAVKGELRSRAGEVEAEAVGRLCGLVDNLHICLIREMSVRELAPAIQQNPDYRNQTPLKGLADRLVFELGGFEGSSGDYECLVARSTEIRSLLVPADAAAPALECLDRLMAVVEFREPLQGIRESLPAGEEE